METRDIFLSIKQILVYITILLALTLMVYGIRKVYLGYIEDEQWAKITAIILIVITILAIIGGIIFFFYAQALGKAFQH